MFYTIMPIDIILSNENNLSYDYSEKIIDGQLVQINKNNDGKCSLLRVITTDPSIYLNKKFQPGTQTLI